MDALAAERTLRWAIAAACLPVLQVWGNIALHSIFGFDWLGTKPLLADPTFVALFGQLRIGLADWVPVFAALMPLLALLGLLIVPGLAHMMSKLWRGQGTFEQMVNTLTFATIVPNMTIAATTEWLFGVPIDLLTGHKYWWVAAMQGEFGTAIAAVWNFWVIGVYITFAWVWAVALGSIAIRRIQKIPMWAAGLTMTIAFAISMFIQSIFVR
jgi:hypothetical protein